MFCSFVHFLGFIETTLQIDMDTITDNVTQLQTCEEDQKRRPTFLIYKFIFQTNCS